MLPKLIIQIYDSAFNMKLQSTVLCLSRHGLEAMCYIQQMTIGNSLVSSITGLFAAKDRDNDYCSCLAEDQRLDQMNLPKETC